MAPPTRYDDYASFLAACASRDTRARFIIVSPPAMIATRARLPLLAAAPAAARRRLFSDILIFRQPAGSLQSFLSLSPMATGISPMGCRLMRRLPLAAVTETALAEAQKMSGRRRRSECSIAVTLPPQLSRFQFPAYD